jgi:hypothetical protein
MELFLKTGLYWSATTIVSFILYIDASGLLLEISFLFLDFAVEFQADSKWSWTGAFFWFEFVSYCFKLLCWRKCRVSWLWCSQCRPYFLLSSNNLNERLGEQSYNGNKTGLGHTNHCDLRWSTVHQQHKALALQVIFSGKLYIVIRAFFFGPVYCGNI